VLADLSLQQMLLRVLAFVVIAGVHGGLLAAIALAMGDRGPKYDGRLTFSPFAHLDMLGLAAGVASRLAWIRPMAIDPAELRGGRAGLAACALASLAALLPLALAAVALRPLAATIPDPALARYAISALGTLAECLVWFAAFNLLPLPPLTGGHLLAAAAPRVAAALMRRVGLLSFLLAATLVIVGGVWFTAGRQLTDLLLR
jgi:Zn-dependent protease